MTEPTQTCQECGRVEVVRPDGRGFPPDIAKRRLKKRCVAAGCPSDPRYLAGMSGEIQRIVGGAYLWRRDGRP